MARVFIPVQVKEYSGVKANERPVEFILDGIKHDIVEIVDRWYEGGMSPRDQKIDYFKVKTRLGEVHIIRYLPLFDSWSILKIN